MSQLAALETASLRTHSIVFSDKVLNGSKKDHTTPACVKALETAGTTDTTTTVVFEQYEALYSEIRSTLSSDARLVLVLGGPGSGVGSIASKVVREVIEVEIPGITKQIRSYRLRSAPLSSLSCEAVGVTTRDSSGVPLVASPGSKDGALDTLAIFIPLPPMIYHQLNEEHRAPMGSRIDMQERPIAAARRIVIKEGMETTSPEHTCETVGFTRGAFYSNFVSKDSLLVAFVESEYMGLIERPRLTTDHWASGSSPIEEDDVEASDKLLIESLPFEALDAIGTNRELHLLYTELLLCSIRDPEWAKRFLGINLESVDELGRSLEWILEAAGRELTHPLRALTHSVIDVVMRTSGVAAQRESMQTSGFQEGTTKPASSPTDSIPASSLYHVQASAQDMEFSQRLRSENEGSARASGAREILETILHLLHAPSRPRPEW